MRDVTRLEDLGRKVMAVSVEAEYLGLAGVVGYMDMAFADIVRLVAEQGRVQSMLAPGEEGGASSVFVDQFGSG